MLTVSEALAAILAEVKTLPAIAVPLADALGLVLAEEVRSNVDSPPFTKSLMDGYAIRSADVQGPGTWLKVVDEVTAGNVPRVAVHPGEAVRIMTGAPLPAGADAVVPVEETSSSPAAEGLGQVVLAPARVVAGACVLPQGAAARTGDLVVGTGRMLRAQEIGALAELGQGVVQVHRRPRVAILATGDELVHVSETPSGGQIRNSNEPMLAAQIRQAGGETIPLGIARDERAHLRERIEAGLGADMLLLSGGVSAGKLDFVPSELAAAGVRQIFHKIQMRPGKPLWFGVREQSPDGGRCYVFGLPGNPVSSMVCCELFARTALRGLMGCQPAEPVSIRARLTETYEMRGNRPTYHPARLEWTETGPVVHAVDWIGSSDLRATVNANAMVLFPAGDRTWSAGESMDVFPW